jgi:hypothetical protein
MSSAEKENCRDQLWLITVQQAQTRIREQQREECLVATLAFEGRKRRAGEGHVAVGVSGVALVVIETIVAVMEPVAFGQARAILLIGGPLAALFAGRPLALGQGLRALADVAEYVENQQCTIR